MRRSTAALAAILFLLVAASATFAAGQGITLSGGASHTDLHVMVVQGNDHPTEQMYHVHLLNSSGVQIADQATDLHVGEAIFRNIAVGNYQVNVTGGNIEAANISVTIFRGENSHYEYVRVKPKASDQPASSNQGSVSSAALNIPDKARKEFEKGMAAFEKQDYDAAQQRLTHAAEIYPQYSLAYVNLGIIAMKQNRQDDGTHYFQDAIKADPQDPAAYIHLGRYDIMQKKYSDAEPLLTKAVSISPLNAEALMMLAASELYTGKLDEAIANAKRVHAVPHEQFAVAHLLAAQAYTKKNDLNHAAEEYKQFLAESPNSPNAATARAALQSIESRPK